ncbi:hypothetical protein Tco_0080801 [Tanacetum coccineum]
MSVRLADRSFQYPIEIAENMLVEVGKITILVDFIILEMEEDSKNNNFNALLDEGSEILHSIEGTIIKEKLFPKFDEFMAMNIKEDAESKTEEIPIEKFTFNTDYKSRLLLKNLLRILNLNLFLLI